MRGEQVHLWSHFPTENQLKDNFTAEVIIILYLLLLLLFLLLLLLLLLYN